MKFGNKSTVSRAYLDYASPKLTNKEDNMRDVQKNNDFLKDMTARGLMPQEDVQWMLDQQKK
jgi:hypothetical protein